MTPTTPGTLTAQTPGQTPPALGLAVGIRHPAINLLTSVLCDGSVCVNPGGRGEVQLPEGLGEQTAQREQTP